MARARAKIGLANLPPGLAPGTYRTCLMDDTDPRALNQAKDQPPDDGLDRSNPLLRLGLASQNP
jgi:hypothetical protein